MDKRGQQRQQTQRGAVPEEVKPLTIANLPEAERAKISRLVERLVTLGREHEDIVAQQSHDKVHYNDEIKKISATMNENDTKNKTEIAGLKNDIEVLEAKCGLAYGLLKVYQEKMQKLLDLYETSKNNNDNDTKTITTLNEDIQRLEILVQDQKSSIKRYSDDAKKRDLIETSPAAKYSYEVKTLEMEKRYNELDKKYKNSERRNQELEKHIKDYDKSKKDIEKGRKELEDAVIMMSNQLGDTKKIISDKNDKCSRLEREVSVLTDKLNSSIMNSPVNNNINDTNISNLSTTMITNNNENNNIESTIIITAATDIDNSINYFDNDNSDNESNNSAKVHFGSTIHKTNNDTTNSTIIATTNTKKIKKKKVVNKDKDKSPYYSKMSDIFKNISTDSNNPNTSQSIDMASNIVRSSNTNTFTHSIIKKKSNISDNSSINNNNNSGSNTKTSSKQLKKVKTKSSPSNIVKIKRSEKLAYEIGVNGEYDNSLFELLDDMNIN